MTNNAAQSLARLHAAQESFYGGGDDGPVREVLCPVVVWVVPGASPIAGRHVGVEAVMAYFTKRRELAANTFRMRPAELLAGDGDRVAMVTYGTATIDGREQSWGTVGLYRLRGWRIAECHLLPFDQAQFDRIWTPAVYDEIGAGYVRRRQPDPRIAAAIHGGLGDARTVVNVGAGTGSYEPADRYVVAVEPSRVMAAQRPPGSAPVVVGSAANLPLADATVDAAMTAMSLHHWPDWRAGLAKMRRVARDRVVLFTWDPGAEGFWLTQDYLGWLMEWDARRFPTICTSSWPSWATSRSRPCRFRATAAMAFWPRTSPDRSSIWTRRYAKPCRCSRWRRTRSGWRRRWPRSRTTCAAGPGMPATARCARFRASTPAIGSWLPIPAREHHAGHGDAPGEMLA